MQCMNDFHIVFFRSRQVTLKDAGESDTSVYKREKQRKQKFFPPRMGSLIYVAMRPPEIQKRGKMMWRRTPWRNPAGSTTEFVPKPSASSQVSLWGRRFMQCSCLSNTELVGVDRKWSWTVALSVRLHYLGVTAATRYVVWGVGWQSVWTWWETKSGLSIYEAQSSTCHCTALMLSIPYADIITDMHTL